MDVCRERSGPPVAPRGPPLSPREILDPYAPALALFRPNPSPEPGFPLLKIYEPPLNAPLPPLLSLSLFLVLSHSHSIVARFGGNNWSTLFPEITLLPRAISLLMKVIRTSCFVTFRRYKYFNFAPGREEGGKRMIN